MLKRSAAVLLVAASLSCSSVPRQAARAGVTSGEIAAGIHLIGGTFVPGQQPDGNTVVLDTPNALIVVDTGRHAAHTQKIVDHAAAVRKPIAAVVNTHWHLDHIGGNPLIRQRAPGARIYASAALGDALTGFLASYRQQLSDMIATTTDEVMKEGLRKEVGIIDAGDALRPTDIVVRSGKRTIAGRSVDVHLERNAVTGGDVWLLDRAAGVAIVGDLVTLPVPFLDTACPAQWRSSLTRISEFPFDVVIPGHGRSLSRSQFSQYRASFGALLDCAASDAAAAQCMDGWIGGTAGLDPAGDETFTRSLLDYYVGLLRGDPARTKTLCGE